jgi:Carboxypeptidase regulatory-like domain
MESQGVSLRATLLTVAVVISAVTAFAQGDRGTITGTISDPAGAVVASAPVQAKNLATGAVYDAASTDTGNFTLSQLPAGGYEISVTVPGFKKYVRTGLTVEVAATVRVDIALEVGSAQESVTINAEAPLLKTESGEMSHNVATETLDTLPVLGVGASAAGSSGIRNPTAVTALLPGTFVIPNSNVRVNGAPGNTASYRIEGQDSTNGQVPATQAQNQPSVDAIQEVTIQTSNFAAEYGQVGGGFFNYTMKSGTNSFHGTAYDYFVNEILNAGTPWVNTTPAARRNDYGFTVGGPVWIPKIYNGHDKTFFFVNFEQFRETEFINGQALTVPTTAYRAGNFSAAQTGQVLGTDPQGRPIMANTVYDPRTAHAAPNGQIVTDPFVGNIIPANRMDPVALKIQAMLPPPTSNALINNGIYPYPSQRVTSIPAFKIDHSLGANSKFSYYYSSTKTASQYSPTLGASDGLPLPITAAIGTFILAHTQRLNFDQTLTPTLLFHAGIGYQDLNFNDDAPVLNYNASASLGLNGATVDRMFPNIVFPASQPYGGGKNLGPNINRAPLLYEKPTANTSTTWVKGNHTFKFGGEYRSEGNAATLYTYTNGSYTFSPNETGLPYLQTSSIGGGTVGFAYASFLLGLVDAARVAEVQNLRLGKHGLGFFAQDTWKVTRKLTLDYGLRYDFQTYLKEHNGELANFSPTTPNPSAGGLPGAVEFEGNGQGRCNCDFAKNYPYAFGPRLGAAYQFAPKTVLRVGWGLVYSDTGNNNGATAGLTAPAAVQTPSFGTPVMTLQGGVPFTVAPFPNFSVGQYPQAGYTAAQAPLVWYDQNAGRPARQMQWSIGLQRELTKDLLIEATYVGNRGVWWNAPGEVDVNAITTQILTAHGLSLNSAADRQLLNSPLNSPTAAARGFNIPPFSGFPLTATVAQSLRPFPQFTSITALWAPDGDTWYDALQTKVTKRYSYGLAFTALYSWQKQLSTAAPTNVTVPGTGGTAIVDVENRSLNKALSPYDQPQILTIAASYTVPRFPINKLLSLAARDWTLNALLSYSSGLPILAPYANNQLNQLLLRNVGTAFVNSTPSSASTGTFASRVPGVPLFTEDLNCHCFDPNKVFVLNPAAWTDPPAGQFGTSAPYYNDYRYQRHPVENVGLGRIFRIRERYTLNIRIEFDNIFNRAQMPNPTANNALQAQTYTKAGAPSGGFGFINTAATGATTFTGTDTSRQGTIVGRFTF